MQDYRNLMVWRKAHQLVLDIYEATARFPEAERFGLTSQIRRGAVSIVSNIAEGCGRNSERELSRFLHIALGSAMEVSYQTLLARDLEYLDEAQFASLDNAIHEVRRMLWVLADKLKVTNL